MPVVREVAGRSTQIQQKMTSDEPRSDSYLTKPSPPPRRSLSSISHPAVDDRFGDVPITAGARVSLWLATNAIPPKGPRRRLLWASYPTRRSLTLRCPPAIACRHNCSTPPFTDVG